MTVTEMVKNNLTSESLANYQNNDVKWRRVVSVSFSESKYADVSIFVEIHG